MSSARIGTSGTTVRAFVSPQVDSVACTADPGEECRDELVVFADEREDRAVVVDVGVNVEKIGLLGERRAQRVDRRGITPFREVRDRFERQPHARTLGA
jgi:hypothetical protein